MTLGLVVHIGMFGPKAALNVTHWPGLLRKGKEKRLVQKTLAEMIAAGHCFESQEKNKNEE